MRRVTAGFGALILSAVLLVGIPAALIFLAGNPIPSWDGVVAALTTPDYGGEFLIGTVIPLLAWAAWATFAIGYLAEIPNQLRAAVPSGRSRRVKIPGLGLQQKAAGVLIAAIIAVFAPNAAMASEAPSFLDQSPASISISATTNTHGLGDEGAEAEVEEATPATAAAPLYTVKPGDSLWAIAETALGDGHRYGEIFELNKDREQPGGYTVGQRNGIDPGMVLELPAETGTSVAAVSDVVDHASAVDEQRTIVKGDTLWDIATEELGAGERYPEIFEASRDVVQQDGRTLTDPNLILPGWTVTIPGTEAATVADVAAALPEAPAEDTAAGAVAEPTVEEEAAAGAVAEPTVEEEAATGAGEGAAASAESTTEGLGFVLGGSPEATLSSDSAPAAEEAPAAVAPIIDDAAADHDGQEWTDIVSDWRTMGGIGGLLAAGLLVFLGWRRRQQRRGRKPGQRIAMPTPDINAVELELRAVENPQGMDAVDHALRQLAVWAQDNGTTLPALYALRLSDDEISVFLDEPVSLPEPFTPVSEDDMAWAIQIDQLAPLDRTPSAPYPALVTLGHDENDAHLMVDLERLGSLNVDGTPEIQSAALTALALELATSTWAENLQVTLVGIAPGLPEAIGSDRIRHIDDIPMLLRSLRGQAETITAALEDAGLASLEEARTAGPFAESWTPEIIVLGELPDEDTQAELAELVTRVPRVGIAAIAAGTLAGGWNFRIHDTDTAELEIPGTGGATLPLTPQVVSREDYERILALFTVASDEVGVDHTHASDELTIEEIFAGVTEQPSTADADSVTVDDAPLITGLDTETETTETVAELPDEDAPAEANALAPVPAAAQIPTIEAGSEASAEDIDDIAGNITPASIIDLHTPRLQLLGPVTVLNPQGDEPSNAKQWNSQRLRAIEMIAFIATHPDSTTEQVHEALWPGNDPTRGTQSRNRLTTAARRWLGQDSQGQKYLIPAAKGTYALTESFTSDWDDWQRLVGDDPTQASTENLLTALSMVKGQPISGVKDKYYVWSETLRQEMIAAIGDAAHELATRAMREGNTRNARMAAAIGRMVDPINEVLWRDALRAEHLAGDIAGVERLVTQLENALTQIDPDYAEPEPETEQLIEQLRARHAMAG